MRNAERIIGILTGIFGLAGLIVTVMWRTMRIGSTGWTFYAPLSPSNGLTSRLPILGPIALAAGGALLVCVGALCDASPAARRGIWLPLLLLGEALAVLGFSLLTANSVYVEPGVAPGSIAATAFDVSVALLFFPAALTGAVVALLTIFRREPRVAHP